MLNEADLSALWITFQLASLTTLILLIIGTPFAWWLARTNWRGKPFIEAIVALPLVLPPTVLGFYLLIALGPHGPIGSVSIALGGKPLAFSFTGLVIGSVLYSLPFVIQPLQSTFANIGKHFWEAAATLRASPLDTFFSVIVPLARPGFLTAIVLGFAHTIGEFGVVLMIGGNIPGKTQVVSIAIYDHVENLAYVQAHWLAGGLLLLSFLMLVTVYTFNRKFSVVNL
ncbi:MAG: molybdate ABC transporter permease subunit [Thiomargarita sp.]|nr:molybdate ABC transporter permease subunit [Thiomargarita sp.]